MDTVSLWLTGKMINSALEIKKVIAASSLGALVSTLVTSFDAGIVVTVSSGFVCSLLMCIIVFGHSSIRQTLKSTALLWFTGFLLGGVLTFLTSGESVRTTVNSHPTPKLYHMSYLPACIIIIVLMLGVFMRISRRASVGVEFELFGRSVKIKGLVDSGNLLCDPIGGLPVVIVSEEAVSSVLSLEEIQKIKNGIFDEEDHRICKRYRLVPAKGISGEVFLQCLLPERITVNGKRCRALLGFGISSPLPEGLDCIVPSSLL